MLQMPHLEKRASQEPWLKECGGLRLMPAEQIWRDLRLLVNKAQIEAGSADGSQGWGQGGTESWPVGMQEDSQPREGTEREQSWALSLALLAWCIKMP